VLVILYVRKTSTNSEAGVTRLKRALASPRGKKRVGLSVFFVTGYGALRCFTVPCGVVRCKVCLSVRASYGACTESDPYAIYAAPPSGRTQREK